MCSTTSNLVSFPNNSSSPSLAITACLRRLIIASSSLLSIELSSILLKLVSVIVGLSYTTTVLDLLAVRLLLFTTLYVTSYTPTLFVFTDVGSIIIVPVGYVFYCVFSLIITFSL